MKKWYIAILTGLLTVLPTLAALAESTEWN